MKKFLFCVVIVILMVGFVVLVVVLFDEVVKFKLILILFGGEWVVNKDGSILVWDGKVLVVIGIKVGDILIQFYFNEKLVLQISVKNMAQYVDKFSEGIQVLMKKYLDIFWVDVYLMCCIVVVLQYVYDNILKNVINCKIKVGGYLVEGCFGGIFFLVFKEGVEVIWNYLLWVEVEVIEVLFKNIVGIFDGNWILVIQNEQVNQYLYYYKDGLVEKWVGEYFFQCFFIVVLLFKVGELLVICDGVDFVMLCQIWQYLVGQCCVWWVLMVVYDMFDFVVFGVNYFDEVMGIMGYFDCYQWKLVGKKEMYILYNVNVLVIVKE